jgi:hypothetical protein
LISRDPNWEDASVKATSVMEKTDPATPIMAPEIVDNMLRAESELFTKKKRAIPSRGKLNLPSMYTRPIDNRIAAIMVITGIN